MSLQNCPVCDLPDNGHLLHLNCGNLDHSALYPVVRLTRCDRCGHIYNSLTASEIARLATYYNEDYAPTNLQSVVKTGDLPGSTSKFTRERYQHLFDLLGPYLNADPAILDVGCAAGGFLDFLRDRGFTKLFGIEPTEAYLDRAKQNGYEVKRGQAEHLDYGNGMFDAVVIEQVLEHLEVPAQAFREAGRVLKPGGTLCIGVPDASRYTDLHYFDFYWLLMREHIQHFTPESLVRLAAQHGFEPIVCQQTALPLMGEAMVMPNLSVSFVLRGHVAEKKDPGTTSDPQNIKNYVDKELERLEARRSLTQTIRDEQRAVYAWGIGREFLYLYEAAGLKHCNIRGLIDLNPFKQRNVTVGGMKISPPDILEKAPENSVLIIGAQAYKNDICRRVDALNFAGSILDL